MSYCRDRGISNELLQNERNEKLVTVEKLLKMWDDFKSVELY